MTSSLSRREFLKLAGLVSLNYAAPQYLWSGALEENTDGQNVLIIVFDAWSALNISLYGYNRFTTPNLERLAEKAIVYHNHFAGGHFTTPGTASLLTGTTPWTHRAFKHGETVASERAHHNIFNAFANHHSISYTHNPLANTLLQQFIEDIDNYNPWQSQYFESDPLVNFLFKDDQDVALIGWRRAMKRLAEGHSYSLYLSQIYESLKIKNVAEIAPQFPRGIPNYDGLGLNFFTLEQGLDWLAGLTGSFPQPFLGYFHFLPPHDPYNTRLEFIDAFADDGFTPLPKPLHPLEQTVPEDRMQTRHRWYDEFILYVDAEFARLYRILEESGSLENTWLVLTSDHGEMFERGILGHIAPVFHQPISHIPLMIFPPGQSERRDVYERSAAIDLLPTLLHITGQAIPEWAEGVVLPPFAEIPPPPDREVTSVQVEKYHDDGSVAKATAMLIQGKYKLMWHFGYEQLNGTEYLELYDLAVDPQELENLYLSQQGTASELLEILKHKIAELGTKNL